MPVGDFSPWSLQTLLLSTEMMNVRLLGKYGQIQKMYQACQTCPSYQKNIERTLDLEGLEKNEKAIAS